MDDASTDDPVEGPPAGDATRLLLLERLDHDLLRNRFSAFERNDHIFGGQVLAQALAAASATIEGRTAHSLHGYFLRAGSARQRVTFHVERSRDGGRFSTRRVVATQNGLPIFHLDCSFHAAEPGFAHQKPMPPDVPAPETLPTLAEVADLLGDRIAENVARTLRGSRLIEARLVDPEQLARQDLPARRRCWLRVPSAAGAGDPRVHQQLLAYLSDLLLAGSILIPHPVRMGGAALFVASLDHALWFHAPHRADDWILYDCDSPWAGGGRGLARGLLYNRDGALVASVAQEALIRLR